MNNDICTNKNKCKDCDDRYTEVLEQVQALPIQWQMEIADTVYKRQGYKTRKDFIPKEQATMLEEALRLAVKDVNRYLKALFRERKIPTDPFPYIIEDYIEEAHLSELGLRN